MKTILIQLLALSSIFFITGELNAQTDENNGKTCLQIHGLALDGNNKPINGAEVRLLMENEEMEWTELTSIKHHEHSFKFHLLANKNYTIEVSKFGYVSRSISICTSIPEKVKLERIFRYEFDLQLFKEVPNVDDHYLDFPVALIRYDLKKSNFDYNHQYTKHIKSKIKETTGQGNANSIRKTKNKKQN